LTTYADRKDALLAVLGAGTHGFGLAKDTSNLFRDRAPRPRPKIDLHGFDHVLAVDPSGGTVESEGMVRYVDLADATLARGVMPAVVPQLKSITLGGAHAGVGIEASSFRHGLVHDTSSRSTCSPATLIPTARRTTSTAICSSASRIPTARWATPSGSPRARCR
jgi:FAD/FMN-containing dehydrogenase